MAVQQQLGRYEIIAEIGRGAMGVVYKARDPIIDRVLAIKSIDFRSLGEAQASVQARFFQEAKSAGRLSHPNIVTIYDAGEAAGCAYIAMELLEGLSLREVLDEQPPLAIGRALEIAAQIARGLAYAHEHGVVHRDVKPANVILSGSRRVKITDFGIARVASGAATAPSELVGSPKYMSPEQVRGHSVDGRSDIFSLGAMLYEMLTGRQPFTGEGVPAIMHAVLNDDPEPPSTLNPLVPSDVDTLVGRMLAKRVDDRPASARALLREFTRLVKAYGDKDTRELEISGEIRVLPAAQRAGGAARAANEGDDTLILPAPPEAPALERPRRRATWVRYGFAGLALVVIAAAAMSLRAPTQQEMSAAAPVALVPGATPAREGTILREEAQPVVDVQSAGHVEAPAAPSAAVESPPPPAKRPAAPPRVTRKPAETVAAPAAVDEPPAAPPPKPLPREMATIVVAVSPWGEVFIDGESRGTAPPVSTIQVAPGKRRVEIRNGTLAPYRVEVGVEAGATHRIKHRFE